MRTPFERSPTGPAPHVFRRDDGKAGDDGGTGPFPAGGKPGVPDVSNRVVSAPAALPGAPVRTRCPRRGGATRRNERLPRSLPGRRTTTHRGVIPASSRSVPSGASPPVTGGTPVGGCCRHLAHVAGDLTGDPGSLAEGAVATRVVPTEQHNRERRSLLGGRRRSRRTLLRLDFEQPGATPLTGEQEYLVVVAARFGDLLGELRCLATPRAVVEKDPECSE